MRGATAEFARSSAHFRRVLLTRYSYQTECKKESDHDSRWCVTSSLVIPPSFLRGSGARLWQRRAAEGVPFCRVFLPLHAPSKRMQR